MICIGVDPGVTGAIAAVRDGRQLIYLADMPTKEEPSKTRKSRSVCGAGVNRIIREIISLCPGDAIEAIVEQTHAGIGAGSIAGYSMGYSRGVVEGVIGARGMPLTNVRPAIWKKAMGLTSEKGRSRHKMLEMFPGADIKLVKHHDRAEAIALALYLWKTKFE